MADRYPLIYNPSANQIQELQSGDSLDVGNASIKNVGPFVGVITATGFSTSGGTSSQFLKADGSVDSNTYLTSVSTSSLDAVTDVGNTTTNGISVGVVTASSFVKSGGTSSQFLKADGTVDSNTYLTAVGIQSGGVTIGNATTLNFVGTGNTFAVNGSTIDVSISGGGGGGVAAPSFNELDAALFN